MKRFCRSIAAAFSMFSAIPVPYFPWTEDIMRYMLCAFPLVGVLIGLLCYGWNTVCLAVSLPDLLRVFGLWLLPILVTGGIHLDGCCDTWDALAACGDQEKTAKILKDPHIGSFAVIRLICMLLGSFVFWMELKTYRPIPILLMFVLSRSLSALAVVSFPLSKESSLAASFAASSDKRNVRIICLAITGAAATGLILGGAWCMAAAAALILLWYRFVLTPRFGGLSGDLAGWFLQTAELWMLAALCVTQSLF
ncbi:MAG: adenosylcobinamide-GDP ribazoletransferase [Lachnospiraceae bacterium]|nr:adenosylcobinamide-GDP ribazoletransferase [Lachnospiraceae bacterium]